MNLLQASDKKLKISPKIGMRSELESIDEDRDYQVALRAYYKAEARGYEPGHEIQDWLDAEAEIIAETK